MIMSLWNENDIPGLYRIYFIIYQIFCFSAYKVVELMLGVDVYTEHFRCGFVVRKLYHGYFSSV